jgi:hypothetical protein
MVSLTPAAETWSSTTRAGRGRFFSRADSAAVVRWGPNVSSAHRRLTDAIGTRRVDHGNV